MIVSIIIPTKNRHQDLLTCIRSLMAQTVGADEILVVDASDTDQLKSLLLSEFHENPMIRYIHTLPGLTMQRNTGVAAATGDILFFLDDDVILDTGFIEEIVRVFKNDPEKKIGGVFGNIVESIEVAVAEKRSTGKKSALLLKGYSLFASVFLLSKISNDGKFQPSGFPTYPYGADSVRVVECVPGGLTAYRKEVFSEFGFDEELTGYGYMEDDDFSYRVSRKYKNIYTPFARVIHNESPAARDHRYESRKMMIMNHYYLFRKNLPQDLWHRVAFWWSVLGLGINETVTLNFAGFKGLLDGLVLRGNPYRK